MRLLYDHAGLDIVGSLVGTLIIGGAMLPEGDRLELAAWTVAMVVVGALRAWLVRRFRRSAPGAAEMRRWLRLYVLGAFCVGLGYGYAGFFLPDGQPEPLRLLLYLVLAGAATGSVAAYGAVLSAFLAFALPAGLAVIAHFVAAATDRIGLIHATATLAFLALLIANAWRQRRQVAETLGVMFDNLDLIGDLEEAKAKAEALNDSLEAEIAERRRIEADRARSVALYQATMDAVDEGILALDRDQRVVAINRRFRELWRLADDDVAIGGDPGRAMAKALDQMADRDGYLTEYAAQAPDDPGPHGGLVELRDGRVFERCSVPYQLDGAVIGRVRTIRDVTARIRTERELRRAKEAAEAANRAKSDFLAHISHELRTPLNAIIGFSDVIRQEMFGPLQNDRYRAYTKDIHDSANLLLSLINDILDLSKIEAGRAEPADETIGVADLVADALRLIRDRAGAGGIAVEQRLPARLPALRGDRRACDQMLTNLLTNAVKFTPAGGRVAVTADLTAAGELALAVRDTGIGMAAQDIPRALEPFRQIDSPMNRRHQGTGLGLALSKALVEAHGGRLELDSAPGQGTVARLVFPAGRLTAPVPAPLPARSSAGR